MIMQYIKNLWHKWFGKTTNDQIEEKKQKLESARKAVNMGRSLCDEYERMIRIHTENINNYKARIDKALKSNNDESALDYQDKLDKEETLLANAKEKYEKAKKDQRISVEIVEQFQNTLHSNVNDLKDYERQLEIAEAKRETAQLAMNLSTETDDINHTKEELKRKITKANLEAETASESMKLREDKFSDIARKEELMEKLNKRKQELS